MIGSEIVAGGDNIMAALPDVIGHTLGGMITGSMGGSGAKPAEVGKTPQNAKQVAAECGLLDPFGFLSGGPIKGAGSDTKTWPPLVDDGEIVITAQHPYY